jgi:hypothetical protein
LSADVEWSKAEAHALAAAALLDDPSVPPWTAAESLRRGYASLARTTATDDPTIAAAQRALATDDDASLDPTTLRTLARALSKSVADAAARFAPTRGRSRRRRAIGRAAIGVTLLLAAAAIAVVTVGDWREGPWRAQYFGNSNFEGTPLVLREGDVQAAWGRKGPDPSLPDDRFSVRYDTCMVLTEDLEITFVLTSDDGSRLFVDGELALDNWGVHANRPRSADVRIAAGTHHLLVEYFDDRSTAQIELAASLNGELPDLLPVRLLRYPGDDPEDPCAGR